MNDTLSGKKILIVGGSSGIGLAVAKRARQYGAHVIIASRRAPARIGSSTDFTGESIQTLAFDIMSDDDHSRLFKLTGSIDHLVITVRPDINPAPFQQTDMDEAKRAFDTKFWGQYRLIQTAQSYIDGSGSITMTSGIAGEKIYKGASTMAIINSATETLCRSLAVELAPLRVNVVSPGFIEPKPQAVQEYSKQFPLKRLAHPEEVAMAYVALMANPYATGTITVVDGGARLMAS